MPPTRHSPAVRRGTALHTTRAVVLRTIKHADSRTVMKAYTESFGARSYMVRTSGRNAHKNAALQALSRVELVVTETSERDMHAVREVRVERPYANLPGDPMRGILALFTQEVLCSTLRAEAADPELFDFLMEALETMDGTAHTSDFPVWFLTRLSAHLGFFPEPPGAGHDRFDLREGCFFSGAAPHELCMEPAQATVFARWLVHPGLLSGASIPAAAAGRRKLLDDLLLYYRLHVEGFGELRSPEVLRQVLG